MIVGASTPSPAGLVGHDEAERALIEGATIGRLHHAWLITGPAGIGKATLAFRFACWMLAGQPPGGLAAASDHPSSRRAAAGTHADLLTIARGYDEKRARFRSEIVADDVRPIGDFLRRTAAEGGWRIVILDDADLLNRNAANALLKILEEPPPQAVLILVSAVPGRLLPTIRSRCRSLRLQPLDQLEMTTVVASLLPDQDEPALRQLVSLSHGSPGRALALAGDDGVLMESLVEQVLAPDPLPKSRSNELADRILRKEQGFSTFLSLLADAISGRLRDTVRGHPLRLPERPIASGQLGIDWMLVWQEIRRVRDEAERYNLDKRQALLSSLSLLSGP